MNAFLVTLALALVLIPTRALGAGEFPRVVTNAPATIELHDQYALPRRLSFPATNITVITIGDRRGSEQVDGWVTALIPRYEGRIDLRGIADLGGAPGFVHERIRKKFQQARKHPVMMDWSGKVCAQLGCAPGVANVIIIGRDGRIQGRFAGAAVEPLLGQALEALDHALLHSP